jgi:hypothetical protein
MEWTTSFGKVYRQQRVTNVYGIETFGYLDHMAETLTIATKETVEKVRRASANDRKELDEQGLVGYNIPIEKQGGRDDGLGRVLKHFIDVIRDGGEFRTPVKNELQLLKEMQQILHQ